MLYLKWHNCVRFVNSSPSNPQYFDSIISTTDILSYKSWYFNYCRSHLQLPTLPEEYFKTFILFHNRQNMNDIYVMIQVSHHCPVRHHLIHFDHVQVLVWTWSSLIWAGCCITLTGGGITITAQRWPGHWPTPPRSSRESSAYIILYELKSWISNSMTQVSYIWKVT